MFFLFGLRSLSSSILIRFVPLMSDLAGLDFVASNESSFLIYLWWFSWVSCRHASPVILSLKSIPSPYDLSRLIFLNFIHVYGHNHCDDFDPNKTYIFFKPTIDFDHWLTNLSFIIYNFVTYIIIICNQKLLIHQLAFNLKKEKEKKKG